MNDATKKYIESLENLVKVDDVVIESQNKIIDILNKEIIALQNDNSYLLRDLEAYKAEDELVIIEANKILDANFAKAVFPNQA